MSAGAGVCPSPVPRNGRPTRPPQWSVLAAQLLLTLPHWSHDAGRPFSALPSPTIHSTLAPDDSSPPFSPPTLCFLPPCLPSFCLLPPAPPSLPLAPRLRPDDNSLVEWALQLLALLLRHGRPYEDLLRERGVDLRATGAVPVFGSVPREVEFSAEMASGFNCFRRCERRNFLSISCQFPT